MSCIMYDILCNICYTYTLFPCLVLRFRLLFFLRLVFLLCFVFFCASRAPFCFQIWGWGSAQVVHAFLLSMAQDIKDGKEDAAFEWLRAALCVPVQVSVMEQRSMYFAAIQMREESAAQSDAVFFTGFQRIYMVERFRESEEALKGKLTPKQLAAEFKRVRFYTGGEAMSDTFIENALALYNRAMYIPNVHKAFSEKPYILNV